ncbi:ABC transporter permease [Alphaproteobacteria bacterium]|nr:ABC transporter permease [Alphaproteobacteria bacterium]
MPSKAVNIARLFVLLLFISPLLVGLLGVIVPAFGYFPGLGRTPDGPVFDAFWQFLALPGITKAIFLSLTTGFIATFGSLICSFLVLASFTTPPARRILLRLSGPLIAIPHSTIAIGIVFLLAPSGWLLRLLSPELTGLVRPPSWGMVPDPAGWGLILGLMAKEIPFLTLVGLGAIATLPIRRLQAIGATLGYSNFASWLFVILPLVYRQLRLPLAAVLVFSLTVVDMALILGPSLPPPLAVMIFQGFNSTELLDKLPSSAGALLSIILVLIALIVWRTGEIICGVGLRFLRLRGHRMKAAPIFVRAVAILAIIPPICGIGGLAAALIWSVAGGWWFPDAWPQTLTMIHWQNAAIIVVPVINSLILAVGSSFISIVLALLLMTSRAPSYTTTKSRMARVQHALILGPMLIPQIGFLFGLQVFLSWLRIDGSWLALIWIHAIFILPYSWLIMKPAYDALDPRMDMVAASLQMRPFARLMRVTLPMLAHPIATGFLVGVAVSIALYLATLFAGAGRINTITLEAVSLASGGNRGLTGVAAILQIILPLGCFIILQIGLYLRFRKFSAMRGGNLH